MVGTASRKKLVVGLSLFAVIVALFLSFDRFPKLEVVGEDLDAVTAPEVQCFQGFCIEREAGSTFLTRWWSFSVSYLRLVTVGMTFAFLVAGLAEAFLFPAGSGTAFQSGGIFSRTVKGAAVGPFMNLCSACIVPVSLAFHRKAGLAGAIALVQGSATMNVPALAMVFFVFTPLLGFSRLLLAIVGALLIGPIVVVTVRKEREPSPVAPVAAALEARQEVSPWGPVLTEAFRQWAKTSLGYLVRLGPIMVVAGFASGLAIQWLSPATVSTYLGNHLMGVMIAATFGILINVPLLFEIPLVALLLMMGMGTAPAATLLFTAAAGGPVTFWGLARLMPNRAIGAFAAATWAVGAAGGLAVLGIGALIWGDTDGLRLAAASRSLRPVFADVTAGAGVAFKHADVSDNVVTAGAGAIVFDFNDDGLDDIYITNSAGPNALYRNNGDGTFTDVAVVAGVDDANSRGNGGCAADYDNNGDQDLFVANFGPSRLFRNNGDGTFADVAAASIDDLNDEDRSMGCAWGDYDQDGYLDLVVVSHMRGGQLLPWRADFRASRGTQRQLELNDPLSLYHNNGDGTFTNVTPLLGDTSGPSKRGALGSIWGLGFQPVWVDFDNDGDPDLYVVNDFGREIQPNVLWRNEGPAPDGGWSFQDVSGITDAGFSMNGMGVAVGDYNLDGYFDFFMTNIEDNVLLRNDGPELTFTNTADEAGAKVGTLPDNVRVGWGAVFFDFDNDGDEDLYVVNGFLKIPFTDNPIEQPNALLRNNGDSTFTDVSRGSGADHAGVGRGGVFMDSNRDGCLDLFITNFRQEARLFQNVCDTGNNWLVIEPVGTRSNQDGIGARITVVAGGRRMIREISAGSSQIGQNMVAAHFGLGEAQEADSVVIRWPSGELQSLARVAANQRLTVTEPE